MIKKINFFRCKCNGHADRCFTYQDQDFEEKYKCDCKHNTDGVDCEKCLPFFNDKPWSPATLLEGNECVRKLNIFSGYFLMLLAKI